MEIKKEDIPKFAILGGLAYLFAKNMLNKKNTTSSDAMDLAHDIQLMSAKDSR